jgi:hypothetical protein
LFVDQAFATSHIEQEPDLGPHRGTSWRLGSLSSEGSEAAGDRASRIDTEGDLDMARKYSRGASKDVKREMHKFKRGTLKSGRGGKGGTVKSRKQAIAIGLSEARRSGKKVPRRAIGGQSKSSRSAAAKKAARTRKRRKAA